ncbi:hypothetical protein [Archangium lansingense]|uniref:Uncharacterized protein n=1 Tax=Archangium lansingense TaxID=2995310 RepID=A0ABT4A4E5_9BACT|nr:hypothetical protein [Archangium lansinium]MCY1076516.1 hypothetical protein [Archangium lansinium]
MSNAPIQREQFQSETTPLSEGAGPRGSVTRVASLAKAGAAAAATVAARAFGLGAVGFVLGIVAFFVEKGTGLLAHPSERWGALVYLLLLAYMAAGAIGLGAAGMWRGIGRVAMNLVQEHKLCQRIVERVFERAAILAEGAYTPEILRKPLPIQKLRDVLSRAITAYATSDDDESGLGGFSRSILRRLKLRVCLHVETKLIELIGEETRNQSTVELTLDRLHALAEEELDGRVMDALDGARNQQALLWGGLFVAVLALPPIVLALLR